MKNKSDFKPEIKNNYDDFILNKKDYFTFKSGFIPEDQIIWKLPCSKSHFIRWLFISAQLDAETIIKTPSKVSNDIMSCANVLEKLGVSILKNKESWIINGCKSGKFNLNPGLLDCGNSATTLRFVSFLAARNGINATIMGDNSLSNRNFSELFNILEKGGVSIKKEQDNFLPFTINGTFNLDEIEVFTNKTSQLISAILITMPSSIEKNTLRVSNDIVSKPYFDLTIKICKETGAEIKYLAGCIVINTWTPKIRKSVIIPGESSLIIFALLFCKLHRCPVLVENCPDEYNSLGFYVLKKYVSDLGLTWNQEESSIKLNFVQSNSKPFSIDIRDNIDLITPLCILMAISGGGRIKGITHAENKESNRINSTINLCKKFGLKLDYSSELIITSSNISTPESLILAERDHRLQMSAILLLTYSGGLMESFEWYSNSDPFFIERLYCQGVSIN